MKPLLVIFALLACSCQNKESDPGVIFCVTTATEATFQTKTSKPLYGPADRPTFIIRGKETVGKEVFLEIHREGKLYDVTDPRVVDNKGLWITPSPPLPVGAYRVALVIAGTPRSLLEFAVIP